MTDFTEEDLKAIAVSDEEEESDDDSEPPPLLSRNHRSFSSESSEEFMDEYVQANIDAEKKEWLEQEELCRKYFEVDNSDDEELPP